MFILLKVWFLGFRFSTIYLFFISYLPSISKLSSKSFETIHVTEGEEDNALWDTLGDEEDYMSYIEGTFWWYAIISLKSDFSASFKVLAVHTCHLTKPSCGLHTTYHYLRPFRRLVNFETSLSLFEGNRKTLISAYEFL